MTDGTSNRMPLMDESALGKIATPPYGIGMADSLWMRLRRIDWEGCGISPGDGKKIAKLIEQLSSRKQMRAMKAAHQLWGMFSETRFAPASTATIPFLIEILGNAEPGVQGEILDILLQISKSQTDDDLPGQLVVGAIRKGSALFSRLSHCSKDSRVAEQAQRLTQKIS